MLTKKQIAYAVGANIIGNVLEWYEFYLYVLFTPLFAELFFPKSSQEATLIQALLVFAIGFLSRPLGVVLLGHLGDRLGRRIALLLSILMMAIPTFMIGCLPTYAQIGMGAPILIAVLRLLQGIPTGGEFTGVMCYLYEISPQGRKGIMGSMVSFGAQVGPILSLLEFFLMHKFLSHKDITDWAWRISFILGGVIGLTGWYLRYKLQETPVFKHIAEEGKLSPRPVLESLRKHKRALVKAMLLTALTASGWYLVFIFSPATYANVKSSAWNDQFLITLMMIIFSTLLLPIFGWIADKGYLRACWITSCIGVMLLAFPFYFFTMQNSFGLFIAFKIIMAILLTIQFALFPILLCELFPPPVRYSSVGISYNITTIIMGGFTPAISLFLIRITGHSYIPAYILLVTAFFSLLPMLVGKRRLAKNF